jgi:hypothetical protein
MKTLLASPKPRRNTIKTTRSLLRKKRPHTQKQNEERAKFRAECRAILGALPAGIVRDTPLRPLLMADNVCNEVSIYLRTEIPARYPEWLAAIAESYYKDDPDFRKRMRSRSNSGRDTLYSYMRHWLASFLQVERPDLYCCLPSAFSNGIRLPDGIFTRTYPTISSTGFFPIPLKWDTTRITKRERWSWLKDVKIPAAPEFSHPHG